MKKVSKAVPQYEMQILSTHSGSWSGPATGPLDNADRIVMKILKRIPCYKHFKLGTLTLDCGTGGQFLIWIFSVCCPLSSLQSLSELLFLFYSVKTNNLNSDQIQIRLEALWFRTDFFLIMYNMEMLFSNDYGMTDLRKWPTARFARIAIRK